MGFLEALFLVLLVLKCIGTISVSWFVVFVPLIVGVGLDIVIFLFFGKALISVFKSVNKELRDF